MRSLLFPAFSLMLVLVVLDVAQASSCKSLVSELQLMRKAQQQMITGLADNHLEMAKSLGAVATDLGLASGPVPMKVVHDMNQTSQAFKKRGDKARSQARSLDEATADLIRRLQACL